MVSEHLMFKAWLRIFVVTGLALGGMNAQGIAEEVNGVGFGDSLMAGYQLGPEDAFPVKLEAELKAAGYPVSIANAGVSGDTTSAGLARLDWSVPDGTDFVILELGANDALRGISPDITRENLDTMISRLKDRGIDVILAGIVAPPNMGDDYAEKFNPIFPELAEKYGLPFFPFFLDGAIGDKKKMLSDGMHPNSDGVAEIARRFAPLIKDYLATAKD
jgi:acyl-CoA thioesterase I